MIVLAVIYLTIGATLTAAAAVENADRIRVTRNALRYHRPAPVALAIETAAAVLTVLVWPRIAADAFRKVRTEREAAR